jgi:hypothetical protein
MEQTSFPDEKFQVIYADSLWDYGGSRLKITCFDYVGSIPPPPIAVLGLQNMDFSPCARVKFSFLTSTYFLAE